MITIEGLLLSRPILDKTLDRVASTQAIDSSIRASLDVFGDLSLSTKWTLVYIGSLANVTAWPVERLNHVHKCSYLEKKLAKMCHTQET